MTRRLAIELRRTIGPGQFVSFAGSDIARGETLLRQGTRIGSREIGMLAACGLARVAVVRRPKVAVLSTGDELVAPGEPLKPAGVYDSNGAIIAAAVAEAGGEPIAMGAFPDDEAALEKAVRAALADRDMVVLSGGTSKGAGDLSHRIVAKLGAPGILVHGVALKPGKPLCLGAVGDKPIVVLPGFPTSAIFTFHAFAAPVIRARAGLPPEAAQTVAAHVPVRIASELGRKEFVLVSLVETAEGPLAFPTDKGSGSVTSFSQADGFIEIDALANALDADSKAQVTLIGSAARAPDLVIMGSHDIALDVVVGALRERGFSARTLAVGSLGGVAAASRGQCDVAPVHLIDPASGKYNEHLVTPQLRSDPRLAAHAGHSVPLRRRALRRQERARSAENRARRQERADGQPQCRRRHARADRQIARRPPAARLRQPAEIAQRRRRGDRARPRRLGRGDRAGGEALRPRLLAGGAGTLRLPAGGKPPRTRRGAGVPRGLARSRHARAHRRARHAAGGCLSFAGKPGHDPECAG